MIIIIIIIIITLCDSLYAAKNCEKVFSVLETKIFFGNFLKMFEKVFKILTGRKFEIQCLSTVFLSKGVTRIFGLLGKCYI